MKRQPYYKILSGLTLLLVVGAALTVLPYSAASKGNLLGYKSLCAFVPLSTLVLLGAAAFVRIFRDTQYKSGDK
jgi:ABC-type dipeptide/oligopeptide/nickel transport system permease component